MRQPFGGLVAQAVFEDAGISLGDGAGYSQDFLEKSQEHIVAGADPTRQFITFGRKTYAAVTRALN